LLDIFHMIKNARYNGQDNFGNVSHEFLNQLYVSGITFAHVDGIVFSDTKQSETWCLNTPRDVKTKQYLWNNTETGKPKNSEKTKHFLVALFYHEFHINGTEFESYSPANNEFSNTSSKLNL
jgi:hypothetical protein